MTLMSFCFNRKSINCSKRKLISFERATVLLIITCFQPAQRLITLSSTWNRNSINIFFIRHEKLSANFAANNFAFIVAVPVHLSFLLFVSQNRLDRTNEYAWNYCIIFGLILVKKFYQIIIEN